MPTGMNTGLSISGSASAYSGTSYKSGGTSTSGGGKNGNNKDDEEIMTYLFDRKGYCVRHSHVRLRKKKLLGGWNVLITNCPDCCVEEMNRLNRVRKQQRKREKDMKSRRSSGNEEGKEEHEEQEEEAPGGPGSFKPVCTDCKRSQ